MKRFVHRPKKSSPQQSKPSHRVMAIFLILVFLPSIVPVNLLYASNGGPMAPEASSFEPVDATDMVNLSTGDLSYVLPLLNVPSPEGGYPLALSYHAGIAMDQEASWVGLGWNLNPGAITRSVSGVPDDWYGGKKADAIYNAGGESQQKRFSASVGWGEQGSVGFYISQTSNRAFGGETSYSTDFGVITQSAGFGSRIGTDGIGKSFDILGAIAPTAANADTGEAVGGQKSPLTVGVDVSFKNGAVTGSLSKNGIGISLGTHYGSLNMGMGSVNLYGANAISTTADITASGFMVIIPFYNLFSISYSKRKTRYWTYDRLCYQEVGALYANHLDRLNNESPLPFLNHFDSYESIYKSDKVKQLKENNPSYISYDDYSVNAQGLTGKMTPKLFEVGVLKNRFQNLEIRSDGNPKSRIEFRIPQANFDKSIDNPGNDIHFYFDNFNASYLRLQTDNWNTIASLDPIADIEEFKSNHSFTTTSPKGLSNYNSTTKAIYRGNYVQTYTNEEINTATPVGFIKTDSKGFNRASFVGKKVNKGIGAFSITAIDGKTYHYALPVYQKEKFIRSAEIDDDIEKSFFEEQSLDWYATHWLLTAVTGPDYVDTNNNHRLDEEDYGYWVNFEYGKWSDAFSWRNPPGKSDYTESDQSKLYQWGVKEVYYLNRISTRTHSAFFIKNIRQDNQSTEIHIGESPSKPKRYTNIIRGYQTGNVLGGRDGAWYLKGTYQNIKLGDAYTAINTVAKVHNDYYVKTRLHKTLALEKIVLYKNDRIPTVLLSSNPQESLGTLMSEITIRESGKFDIGDDKERNFPETTLSSSYYGEYYNHVLDVNDVDMTTIVQPCLKAIDFSQNYTLFSGVPNSTSGKLTLRSLFIRGKNGIYTVPPYTFDYYVNGSAYSRNSDAWGYPSISMAGSLRKITVPEGGQIDITYERDNYYKEAVPSRRAFDRKLQFYFYEENGKLRILVENEQGNSARVNFDHFFELGKTELDFWACYKRDYHKFWEGCKNRTGIIDIPAKEVDVIDVGSNHILLETSTTFTSNGSGGLNEIYRKRFGLEHHPGMIRVEKLRGECENPPGCVNVSPRLVMNYYVYSNKDEKEVHGGGVRVKEIAVSDGVGNQFSTAYSYNHPEYDANILSHNYRSSGVTSYAPSKYAKEVKHINELPPPYVTYGHVTVEKQGNGKFLGRTKYQFKVLDDLVDINTEFALGDVLKIGLMHQTTSNTTDNSGSSIPYTGYKYVIEDNLSSIGNLLQVTQENEYGHAVRITQNTYKPKTAIDQGIMEEPFSTYKIYREGYYTKAIHFTSTSKIAYPNVLERVKTVENDLITETHFKTFDFNTGQVLETTTTNSAGRAIQQVVVPAYTQYPSMGTKGSNANNKNMLSQQAGTYTFLDVDGQWKETGVGITTWSPSEQGIWRKHQQYAWNGTLNPDGTYANFVDFDWAKADNQPKPWLKVSETTRYNNYSMPLEVVDVNNNKTTTKMGENYSKIYAVGNAGYNELFYSGAEDVSEAGNFGGGVREGIATLSSEAHTGKHALAIAPGQAGYKVSVEEGKSNQYKVSLWAKSDTYSSTRVKVEGLSELVSYTPEEVVHAGDWTLLNFYFTIEGTQTVEVTTIGSTIVADDFRLHPVSSTMSSYVYNAYDELDAILGPNNLAAKYEYDTMGKLVKVYNEVADYAGTGTGGLKKIKEYKYHYKNTSQYAATGNGEVDPDTQYAPLSLRVGSKKLENKVVSLQAYPSGGSGIFEYQWDISNIRPKDLGRTRPRSIVQETWTTNPTKVVTVDECGLTFDYRCTVRDIRTDSIKEYARSFYISNCGSRP